MKVGFVGLGIMGHPMALNLIKGGHELFVYGKRRLPADVREAGATVCDTLKEIAERSEIVIMIVPDTPDVKSVLFDPGGVAEGLSAGKTVVDMSSISPIETKLFAAEINKKGCDYLDAPVSGGEVGAKAASLTIMVGGPGAGLRQGQAALRLDGQEHHPGRRQWRRADDQGRQPDHRRADDRGGRRSAAVRLAGRRRPGQGQAGADGRLRLVAHPGAARRAHDQAQFRPGLPHRIAPKGFEPGAAGRPFAEPVAAQHRDRRRSCSTPPPRSAARPGTIPAWSASSSTSPGTRSRRGKASGVIGVGSRACAFR